MGRELIGTRLVWASYIAMLISLVFISITIWATYYYSLKSGTVKILWMLLALKFSLTVESQSISSTDSLDWSCKYSLQDNKNNERYLFLKKSTGEPDGDACDAYKASRVLLFFAWISAVVFFFLALLRYFRVPRISTWVVGLMFIFQATFILIATITLTKPIDSFKSFYSTSGTVEFGPGYALQIVACILSLSGLLAYFFGSVWSATLSWFSEERSAPDRRPSDTSSSFSSYNY